MPSPDNPGISRRAVLTRSGALALGAAVGAARRTAPAAAATYVQLRNAGTGLFLDGLGSTSNGASAGQWSGTGSTNQQWSIESDGSYVRIRNANTGLYVDGGGASANGSTAVQWSDTNSNNQQWTQVSDGGNVRFKNRATGLYLDGLGATANGSAAGQWSDTNSNNQQWTIVAVSGGTPGSVGFTFDTGSGLTFTIDPANGNLTSLKHNGVELASGAAGQFESGWSSATVTATGYDNGNSVLYSAADSSIGVTQYYFARKGDNTIYMATDIAQALSPGEARFIARLNDSILNNSPIAAKTAGATVTVEGSDVFGFPNGTTASKFYSSQRLIAQQPFGASGNGHGVFVVGGTHEMSSGGPFFRDIEVNDAGGAVNITHYMYSGHAQTQPTLRLGLHGPYAMAVTGGSAPSPMSMDFLSAYIPGLLSVAQRGTVTGSASGSWGGQAATAALDGPNGQYWAPVNNGQFTIAKVRPGTYTATLYAGELAVGNTASVTVTAGGTSSISLSGNAPANGTIFQLGTWDGTSRGFLNADRIETMHPSDVRMSNWNPGTVAVSSGAGAVPMAMFKSVNSPLNLAFSLSSVPPNGARLRIGITIGFAGGRPAVSIGGWNSPSGDSPTSVDLNSRSITRGTWRGVNQLYTFAIPAGALRSGTNTLSISVISGSSGTGYLSPAFAFDAIALDAA